MEPPDSPLCSKCARRPVPPRLPGQPGHPRTQCFVCHAPKRGSVYDTPELRLWIAQEREYDAALRREGRRDLTAERLMAERRERDEEERTASIELEAAIHLARTGICGCGRDYLTLPIDVEHYCTNPIASTGSYTINDDDIEEEDSSHNSNGGGPGARFRERLQMGLD